MDRNFAIPRVVQWPLVADWRTINSDLFADNSFLWFLRDNGKFR